MLAKNCRYCLATSFVLAALTAVAAIDVAAEKPAARTTKQIPILIAATESKKEGFSRAKVDDPDARVARSMLGAAGDIFDSPSLTREVQTKLADAYLQAIDENKLLVLVLYQKGGPYSEKSAGEFGAIKKLTQIQKCAVTALVDTTSDDTQKNVSRLLADLGITEFPVTSVLIPTSSEIREVGRTVGYFPADTIEQDIVTLVKKSETVDMIPEVTRQNVNIHCKDL